MNSGFHYSHYLYPLSFSLLLYITDALVFHQANMALLAAVSGQVPLEEGKRAF